MSTSQLYFCVLVIAAAVSAPSHAGQIIHVPGDHDSIGAAIAFAQIGDTIIVADGIFTGPDNRNLSFGGKDIIVRSANGPLNCIIDCQAQGRAFIFDDGETSAAVLDGFTIRNGFVANGNGGGIDIALSSSPTIRNCVLRDNWSSALGGGIAVRGQCMPFIDNCVFINNTSFGTEESSEGGGLSLFFLCPATVSNCVFIENLSEYGGGLSAALSDATIVNCLFVGNMALLGGGAVASDVANPRLINCTITENVAGYGGGVAGITQILRSDVTIENSILWNNSPNEIEILLGSASVSYSDVQGGWSGTGNINSNPLFVDPGGPDNDPNTWEDNDFGLSAGSPCIDAADNDAVPPDTFDLDNDGNTAEPTPFDLDSRPRFVDDPKSVDTGNGMPPIVDMGALEFQLESLHVNADQYNLLRGLHVGGDLSDSFDSDDSYLIFDPEFLAFRYQLEFTVNATSPSSEPSALEFGYESRAFSFVGTVDQKIELFNYDSGQFETVDTRLASATDTIVSVSPGGDPARFVQAGTNSLQARISYQSSLPFWVFSTQNLYLPYRVRADHIFWTITP